MMSDRLEWQIEKCFKLENEIEKLKHQAEQDKKTIEKLRECLEFYADALHDYSDSGCVQIDKNIRVIMIGKRARQCLRELESEGSI